MADDKRPVDAFYPKSAPKPAGSRPDADGWVALAGGGYIQPPPEWRSTKPPASSNPLADKLYGK